MTDQDSDHDVYGAETLEKLQAVWGDGFLSPGGHEAVDAIVNGVDLSGTTVLDIGSGLGGPSFLLASRNGAAKVVGIEYQGPLVEQACAGAARVGVSDQVEFITVKPGPLPFEDSSFDVVFSKDSIVHVEDKAALVGEISRVLKPGGQVALSDWFGHSAPLSPEAEVWLEKGFKFFMLTVGEMARLFEEAGFQDVRTEDKNALYVEQSRQDIAALEGETGKRLGEIIGEGETQGFIESCKARAVVAEQGHLRPGHVWARKPGEF